MTIQRHGRTPIMHRFVEHNGVLYVGGLVAEDRSQGMKSQTEQVLARFGKLLDEVGSNRGKVLAATIYITDMALKDEMNAAWTAFFGDDLPTRATIGVADLGDPAILIEVVVTAAA